MMRISMETKRGRTELISKEGSFQDLLTACERCIKSMGYREDGYLMWITKSSNNNQEKGNG